MVLRKFGRLLCLPPWMRINVIFWGYFLQLFTVPDRDQPVLGAMNNIDMAVYFQDPFICAQLISQYKSDGQISEEIVLPLL